MTLTEQEVRELESELGGFIGTEQYYRVLPFSPIVCTDGVQYLQLKSQCNWLLVDIISYQTDPRIASQKFQLWILKVDLEKQTAVLTMQSDSDRPVLVRKEYQFTDFPLAEMKLYYIDDGTYKVILLPSEY